MRILATGGAGYVGSACVRHLLARGHEVWAYDNLSTGHREALPGETSGSGECSNGCRRASGRLIEGDLADTQRLQALLQERQIEAVMHFAGSIAVGESVEKPLLYYRNNVANSLGLLGAMREAQVNKILFSSTAAVYAPSEGALREDSPKEPDSPYAFSKYAIERIITDFSRAYGIGYTILRYFNAAGASPDGRYGENHEPETHLIPLVLQVPLGKREKISVFGRDYDTPDGTCIRDYIHVDDLADAHIRAAEAMEAGKGSVYNIGTGTGNSVLEVIRTAEEVVGETIATEFVERRAGDTARLVASADKLSSKLGWSPKYNTIREIMETAWRWHKSHPGGYGT